MDFQVYMIFEGRQILIAEFAYFKDAKSFLEIKSSASEFTHVIKENKDAI